LPAAGARDHRRATARLAGLRPADAAAEGDPPPATGPARTRPDRLLADKAYSNRKIRTELRRRRIKATIPEKADQQKTRAAKGSAGGRPPAFDGESYKARNAVERAINKLKDFRAVAVRTDKREFIVAPTQELDAAAVAALADLRQLSIDLGSFRDIGDGTATATTPAHSSQSAATWSLLLVEKDGQWYLSQADPT
jgi:transposase